MDLSVVIPLFNKGPYIARALATVLRQTMPPREIVIVDDGSTDHGPAIVESMKEPRVRLIRQANAGASAARSAAIAACDAPWVALLDADDEWEPDFLSEVAALIDRRPGLVCIGTDFKNDDGVPMIGKIDLKDEVIDDFFTQSMQRDIPVLTPSAAAIRLDAFEAAGGFPERCYFLEDVDTFVRLAWVGSIGFIPKPLVTYYQNVPGSVAMGNRRNPTLPIIIETHEQWLKAGRIPERLRESSAEYARYWLFKYVRHLIFHGHGDEARRTLQRFERLCREDPAKTRKLIARSRVPQAIPSLSRRIKSALGVYRKPEFF
jgi:glycosyltransferase involved in cell wall biosynthesis